jgi:hypothetical protein
MQTVLILLVPGFMLVRVQNDERMWVQLLSLVGIRRRLTRSESTSSFIKKGRVLGRTEASLYGWCTVQNSTERPVQ